MYVRLTRSKQSKNPTLQIVEGVRDGKKVRQKIIASLGVIKSEKDLIRLSKFAENLIQKLEQEGLPSDRKIRLDDLVHKKTVHDGFAIVVDKLLQHTGFSEILKKAQGRNSFDVEEVIKLIIAQRFAEPCSKLRTYERQKDRGFEEVELQHVYRAMDVLYPLNDDVQKKAFECASHLSGGKGSCYFFDVTTLYFESVTQDDIRDFGFSKDQKYHSVQIVFALVVDSNGLPIAFETFQGNLAETKTLIPVLESLRKRFEIQNVTIVCDRGMASSTNIKALQEGKFHFVIASKLRSMSKKLKINDFSTYTFLDDSDDLEEEKIRFRTMPHPQYEDTSLIVTYSPRRARKDKEDRERLLKKLREKLESSHDETTVKKVISNAGYKKYTDVKAGSLIALNEEAINEDAAWDGFHGIAVSNSAQLTVEQALGRYNELWKVEEAFRVAKCTFKTRPIFHWKKSRIQAHILICFMALFFERYLEFRLRQEKKALTPDKIRYALSQVQTMHYEEESTQKIAALKSTLPEDAVSIFMALGLSMERKAEFTRK